MIRLGILAPKRKGSSYYVPCRELCEAIGTDEKSLTINGRARVMETLTHDKKLYDAVKGLIEKANNGKIEITPMVEGTAVDFSDDDSDDEDDGNADVPMPEVSFEETDE